MEFTEQSWSLKLWDAIDLSDLRCKEKTKKIFLLATFIENLQKQAD